MIRIIKKKLINLFILFLAVLIGGSWFFSGWPQIFKNIPPQPEKVYAAISLVQQKDSRNTYKSPNNPGSVSVTLDSEATEGNLLVTGVSIDKASGTITEPSGFTLIQDSGSEGENVSSGAMAYKIAEGGETIITWNWTAEEEGNMWVGEYSGTASSGVLDKSAENESYLDTSTDSISTGTTETTSQADELAIAFFTSDSGNSVGDSRSWTNSFSTITEEPVPEESGNPFFNVASKTLSSTQTVESTVSHSGDDESYALVATFKAEVAGGATISSAVNQTFGVGNSATAIETITITDDASSPTITASNAIRIKIPSGFNMDWDASDTAANIAGTDWDHTGAASSGAEVAVSYEDSNRTVVVPVTANFEAGDDITVYGLSFKNFTDTSSSDNLELETANDGSTAATDDKTVTIVAPVITISSSTSQTSSVQSPSTDNVLGSASVVRNVSTGTVTAVTLKENEGTINALTEMENIELWLSDDDSWNAEDEQLGSASNFDGADGEATFTESFNVTDTAKYLIVRGDIKSDVSSGATIEIQFKSLTTSDTVSGTPLEVSGTSTVSGDWWNGSWGYRRKLTFDNSSQSEDLTNFSVLVKLTSSNFDFAKAKSNGEDVRFVDSDNVTELKYEIEKWDNSGEEAIIWVKVSQINGSSDSDYIYMYYNNGSASDGQDAANVWTNSYEAVYHFGETSDSYLDSTSNNHDSDSVSVSSRMASGQFGNCPQFNGTNSYITVPDSDGFDITNWTVSGWFRVAGAGTGANTGGGGDIYYPIATKGMAEAESAVADITFFVGIDTDNNKMGGDFEDDTGGGNNPLPQDPSSEGTAVNNDTWYSFALKVDTSNNLFKAYRNGAEDSSRSASDQPNQENTVKVGIGTALKTDNSTNGSFNGLIDELRISTVARSADWIAAQYLSTKDDLITYGSETQSSVATVSSASNQTFGVGDSSTAIETITITDDDTTPTITSANDIRIKIPSDFNMDWDSTDTTATIGGGASDKVSTTVSYEDDDKTLVVNVTENFAASDSITISDLSFKNFTDTSTSDNLELETDNDGSTVATDGKTIAIVAPTISSASNQSFAVGDSSTAIETITITDNAAMGTVTSSDDIRIKIPASFNMTWHASDDAANIGGTDWDHTPAASQDAEVTVTFEDSNHTAVIPVDENFEAGDDITISGLSFANFSDSSTADNLELIITGSGGSVVATDDKTITVSHASKSFQNGVSPTAEYSGCIDTTIKEQAATTNYGTETILEIDGDDPSSSGQDNGGLLKWDVSDILVGSTVHSAVITVYVENESGATYNLYEMKRNWVEAEATWNIYSSGNDWQTAGAQGGNDKGSTVLGTYSGHEGTKDTSVDITLNSNGVTEVQDWVDNPSTNYGFILMNYSDSESDGLDFTSSEGGSTGNRPKLTVEYTPSTSAEISSAANQSFEVGDSDTTIETITITDASLNPTITSANDIRIKIPSDFNMDWDSTDTTATIGGGASDKVSTTVSYEDDDKTLVVNVTENFAASDSITISDLSFTGFSDESVADNLELEVDNDGSTTATDDKTITIANPVITISSSTNQDISVEPSSTDNSLGSAIIVRNVSTGTVTAVTLKENGGTINASTEMENIELWLSDDDSWDAGDEQLGSASNFDGADGEVTFTESFTVTTSNKYLIVRGDVKSGVSTGTTIEIQIKTLTTDDTVSGTPLEISGTTTVSISKTVAFICDARPAQHGGGQALLKTDFDAMDDQMASGWNLDAIQHIGDMDYISHEGGNIVGAHQDSDVSDVPLFHCVGNHELDNAYDLDDIITLYDSYPSWNLNSGPTCTSPANCEKSIYSYDVGNIHIVVLNEYYDNEEVNQSACPGDVREDLFDWLKSDLRNSTKDYKLVVGHEPAYPLDRHVGDSLDGYETNRDRFWNLLKTEGVMGYMAGHDHNYHLEEHGGVYEADPGVCGGHLGGSNDNFATIIYTHYDAGGFSFRAVNEGGSDWSSTPSVTTVSETDLSVQYLVNTYERAGSQSSYWIDYDSIIEINPDWSSNNSGKWWESGFDDSSWTSGELGTGFDSSNPSGWGWINTSIDPDPNSSGSNHVYGVFQRIPFTVDNKDSYTSMMLGLDYDDAVTVWLNGEKIFESDQSPDFDTTDYTNNFDLTASSDHAASGDESLAPSYTEYDKSDYLEYVNEGSNNTLVIANWNDELASSDLISGAKFYLDKTTPPASYWTVYNDCGDDKESGQSGWDSSGNVTNIGGEDSPSSGNLIDYSDGSDTGADIAFSGDLLEGYGAEHAEEGEREVPLYPVEGTDAHTEFGEKINIAGLSYGASGNLTVTLTGLDSEKTYTLVTSGIRGKCSDRWCSYVISGVDSFTNDSSSGTELSTTTAENDTVTYNCGDNYNEGYVAKWTGVSPTGRSITLTVSGVEHGGDPADKPYLSALKFKEEDNDAPNISSVSSSTGSTAATISWATDESSSSYVSYGLTSDYGTTTSETDTSPRVTSHEVDLASLQSCTTYHYQVLSKDSSSNEASSSDSTFTTTGCVGESTPDSDETSLVDKDTGGNLSHGNLTLTVPSGATNQNAYYHSQQLSFSDVTSSVGTPSGKYAIGNKAYQLKALTDISTLVNSFNQNLTITLSYSDSDVASYEESTLKIYRWTGAAWSQLLNCSVNTAANTVTCETDSFSTFGIFGSSSSNSSSTISPSGGHRSSPTRPEGGFLVLINGGNKKTDSREIIITLRGGPDAAKVFMTEDPEFGGIKLEPYEDEKEFTLSPGSGRKTIYVRFYTSRDVGSETYSDSIILDSPLGDISKMSLSELRALLVQIKALIAQIKGSSQIEGIPAGFKFENNLIYNDQGKEVEYLQRFLKAQGPEIYPEGIVSGWFGPLTKAAVIKFQEKYSGDVLDPWGFTSGTGYVARTTRAKINEMLGF